ncbi:pyridoxal kinase PdxY [Hoeflea sp. WL0058]|uniref:pyridoxal kinase n=1 Tax=Flavimaribacter sediminis TaxID=2865987 RepID=A0AAE2ZRT5_9HYPH|nr:pyridoxal kinase PdxY [Flavimaribacter sediminis]MBW8638372.1 pyridoxal kinase PdxY [Flavimaribacter sediminis]
MTINGDRLHADRPAVLVISSHVVRGSVGNRAAVFALESLGHAVWALPTVVLPWHPGHSPSTRSMLPIADFSAIVDDLCRAPWLGEIGAVLSGYLGHREQADGVARLVSEIRKLNPDALYLCDPVIGDRGGLYVADDIACAIRDTLLPIASIATPNRFELGWLTDFEITSNNDIVTAAATLRPERVLTTSAIPMMAGSIGNLLLRDDRAWLAEHREIANPPNGLGDLLSAAFLSRILDGEADEKALQNATATVFEILARTVKRGADELTLEKDVSSLVRPFAMVHMRRVMTPQAAS